MIDGNELLGLAEDGVRRARAAGADAAEVFISQGRKISLVAHGQYATPTDSLGGGVGVRVVKDGKMATAGVSGLKRVDSAIQEALAATRLVPEGTRFAGFSPPRPITREPSRVHPDLLEAEPQRLEDSGQAIMGGLYANRETSFAAVTLVANTTAFAVANSEGVAVWDRTGRETLLAQARVGPPESGLTAMDWGAAPRPLAEVMDLDAFGRELTSRAGSARGAKPLDSPVSEVIFAPAPAAQAFRLFASSFSGALVGNKQSRLAGRMGEQVASPVLSLRDAPHGEGFQLLRCDHEGTPTAPVKLVDRGRAAGLLYDHRAAVAQDQESNGHGIRESGWSGTVGVLPVRLRVDAGPRTVDDIIAGADRAVYVQDPLVGGFTSNHTTGDFSLVAPYAFLVENGSISRPLATTTVAGNVHDMMEQLHAVGGALREQHEGAFPTLHAGGASCGS